MQSIIFYLMSVLLQAKSAAEFKSLFNNDRSEYDQYPDLQVRHSPL